VVNLIVTAMTKEQKLGIVRHVLTFVGGILLAKGLVDESLLTDMVASIMVLVGGTWSILDKR
jgi:hypothetical protein